LVIKNIYFYTKLKRVYSIQPNISANGPNMLHRLQRAHITHPASTEPSSAHPTTSLPSKNPRPSTLPVSASTTRPPVSGDGSSSSLSSRLSAADPLLAAALRPGADSRTIPSVHLGNEPYTSLGRIDCLPGPLIRTISAGPVVPVLNRFRISFSLLPVPLRWPWIRSLRAGCAAGSVGLLS
jgi:hypothetical protein